VRLDSDTAILGSEPYGLSIAAHLRAAKRPFEIFGTPLESWRAFMPQGMILKSERFASNLWDPARRCTLPEPLVLHSTRMGNTKAYAGRDVTIIGAGQLALESAALLHEAGARVRCSRAPAA